MVSVKEIIENLDKENENELKRSRAGIISFQQGIDKLGEKIVELELQGVEIKRIIKVLNLDGSKATSVEVELSDAKG